MAYRIAGIDVHKRMLAVVVADVGVEGEYEFERRRFSTSSLLKNLSGSNPEGDFFAWKLCEAQTTNRAGCSATCRPNSG